MKKSLFGKEEEKYISKLYTLDEFMQLAQAEKRLVTEEFIFSKLALMAFSL